MNDFLMQLVHASFQGGVIIAVILALRFALKKAPKSILCLLWLLAIARLLLPIQLESSLSLQPDIAVIVQGETIQAQIPIQPPVQQVPAVPMEPIQIGDGEIIEPIYSDAIITPEQPAVFDWASVLPWLWLSVAAGLALWSILSYLRLRSRTKNAVVLGDGIWLSPELESAFVLGYLKPQVYLPAKLEAEERQLVISHEQAHIRRFDHWYKLLGFIALCVHWFNPLVWLAYIFLCRDMEMACDEQVVKNMNTTQRKAYSLALLRCSADAHHFKPCPVAFAEVSVKDRIKGVMNYKKPGFWMTLVGIVAVVFVAVCFLTSPATKDDPIGNTPGETTQAPLTDYSEQELRQHCIDLMKQLRAKEYRYLSFTVEFSDPEHNDEYIRQIEMPGFYFLEELLYEDGAQKPHYQLARIAAQDGAECYERLILNPGDTWVQKANHEMKWSRFIPEYLNDDPTDFKHYPMEICEFEDSIWCVFDATDDVEIKKNIEFHFDINGKLASIVIRDFSSYGESVRTYDDLWKTESDIQQLADELLAEARKHAAYQQQADDLEQELDEIQDQYASQQIDQIIDTYYHGVNQLSPDALRQKCIDIQEILYGTVASLETDSPIHLLVTVNKGGQNEYQSELIHCLPLEYVRNTFTNADYTQEYFYVMGNADNPYEYYKRTYNTSMRQETDTGWIAKETGPIFPFFILWVTPDELENSSFSTSSDANGLSCIFETTDEKNTVYTYTYHFDRSGSLVSITQNCMYLDGETLTNTAVIVSTSGDEINAKLDTLLTEARKHAAYQQQADDLEQELDEIQDQYASQQTQP